MKPGRCSRSPSSCMVVLIGMVGFAVDVGHAYLVQRQLQSGVDAAASREPRSFRIPQP